VNKVKETTMNISNQCWPTPWLEAAMRAGFATYRCEDGWEFINDKMRDMLADFAATVQAAERERCAKLVETHDTYGDVVQSWFDLLANDIRGIPA